MNGVKRILTRDGESYGSITAGCDAIFEGVLVSLKPFRGCLNQALPHISAFEILYFVVMMGLRNCFPAEDITASIVVFVLLGWNSYILVFVNP